MKQVCNRISLDEAALMAALREEAKDALERGGQRLLSHMQREVINTTHGGAPGKPDWRKEIARNLDQLFASPDHPTAIWGQNDYTAKIIYDQLTARGIAIPEDISLIGYDNDTGGLLASVNYSRSDLGKELVEIIWHMYNSGKSDTVIHRGIPSKFYPNKTIGKCKS